MRILITNDDGINAPGIQVLGEIAAEIAGPDGDVWTVAPAFEQSGVGHCISYTHPTMIAELEPRKFAAEGSPADCVLAAVGDIMPTLPDLVLSGVNRGNNAGENTLYSGTIGATIEAALQGIPAIALSQFYGPLNRDEPDPFEASRVHGARVVRELLEKAPWESDPYRLFYNVNFPPIPAGDVKGTKVVAQGVRPGTKFGVTPHASPSGRRFVWISGGRQDVASEPGTDVHANLSGYISVTPMTADLTAHEHLADLEERLS